MVWWRASVACCLAASETLMLFTTRFVVQWLASEKAGKSVIPMAFWWFSISGGTLLLVYALYRKDAVFILGQGLGRFRGPLVCEDRQT